MKKLITLWHKLTDRNFDSKIKSAKNTTRMIVESTNGRCNHFYDMNGNKIRGYSNSVVRTKTIKEHPLISQYK